MAIAATPGYPGRNLAKVVQELDKALLQGDISAACSSLFENLHDGAGDERWVAEVSPCLRFTLKWIGKVSLSFVCSVFFLCEWATCDFRDFRTAPPRGVKFTGRKDFSQVYLSIGILKLKMKDMRSSPGYKNEKAQGFISLHNSYTKNVLGTTKEHRRLSRSMVRRKESSIFESPGALHDIIVCWIDQHEVQNGEGVNRLQLLLIELTRCGFFHPPAYVRQLLVSGVFDRNGLSVDTEKRKRHYKILKHLPGSYVRDAMEESQIFQTQVLSEAMDVYSNERHLLLHGLSDDSKLGISESSSSKKNKRNISGNGPSLYPLDKWTSSSTLSGRSSNRFSCLEDLKAAISGILQFPNPSMPTDSATNESLGSANKFAGGISNKIDFGEGTPGCEECRRAKRQKLSDDKSSHLPGHLLIPSDDEDSWWVKKGVKPLEASKTDLPLKPAKQASRGRQKVVRKTQSLAQLAAARIEGSQGASTSHVCDSRVSCPHHRPTTDGEAPMSLDGVKISRPGDIISVGKILKHMRFAEKKVVTIWLVTMVKQLVEESEKVVTKTGQYGRAFPSGDDKSSLRWKLGEDELSAVLYLMDVSNDLISAVRFLFWLLPKVFTSPTSTIHGGRNVMLARNVGVHVCDAGEPYIVSSIRRYENILVAADLLPEALSAMMLRTTSTLASGGRVSGSASLIYTRHLLKKYGNVDRVVKWEKTFKATCDRRLVPEFDSGRSRDGDFGFPLGVPAGVEDLDDFLRQKITGVRLSRVGMSMREIVQRHVEETFQYFYGKERKMFAGGAVKGPSPDKGDDGLQTAQQIVMGLMECMRQTGGAAQEGDPSLVSSAVSAIVNSIGPVVAKIHDLTASFNNPSPSPSGSLTFARRILRIHINCLYLLKEALGERQSRVFEIALATEASSAVALAFAPGKAPRGQFQPSPEAHDSSANMSSDISKAVSGRAVKITAAVSALLVGAIHHGIAGLERMVTVLRLKEGLDVIHFVRTARSNSNGNARSSGSSKVDNLVEVSVHWFRVLVGNCRTVSDGLIVDLLGEAAVVALSRMQRSLPLSLVFPPAYCIFAFVIWKPFLFNANIANREDIHQLYQSLASAVGDAIKHLPFRDVCLRDTCGLYDLVASDATDSEFAAMLELTGPDMHSKMTAFVPLRARLFLNAIIDCKMPHTSTRLDVGNRGSVYGEPPGGVKGVDNEMRLVDQLIHVLDTLQPAKFHWQWLELRLLLNEQALIERLESRDTSLVEAIRTVSLNPDKAAVSENENNIIEIILTRLLVRPDAASLFSEAIHLLGRSLEDSLLLQVKWFLHGGDVLFGRKSIRQRLIIIADTKGLSTRAQFRKPWGWCRSDLDATSKAEKRKLEVSSLEEGEVVEEGIDTKKTGRGSSSQVVPDTEGFQQHVTERALIELVLSCIDQSSDDSRNTFASDLIKQMGTLEQQINTFTRVASKQGGNVNAPPEVTGNKTSSRKGARGGSPGLARRTSVTADTAPPPPAALRASMSLRLQFLIRLLPIICSDGGPSVRNMRQMLASVVLRLLGNRLVLEDVDQSFPLLKSSVKRDMGFSMEAFAASAVDFSSESLFERLLLVLHGLLSSSRPSWLKSKKEFVQFDREVAENLQTDLDRMDLPDSIRYRIQAAMPVLHPPARLSISCQPPSVSQAAVASLQPSVSVPSGSHTNLPSRTSASLSRTAAATSGKLKSQPPLQQQQEFNMEIDPWTLLEDGAGSGPSLTGAAGAGGGDSTNLRASSWLKGAMRVRRTDLTYIGVVDDDS